MSHHDHEIARLPELTSRLRETEHKITGPRQAILDVLRRQAHPLSNREVHQALSPGKCDLATVYRSMHILLKVGLVQRFDFGDGVARFELVKPGEDGHHHHLICKACSTVVEIGECFSTGLEQTIAKQSGFRQVTHKLEFFGLCPDCQ